MELDFQHREATAGAATAAERRGTPDGDIVITAEGLTKRFRDVVAVHDLSFSVKRGKVTGFLGPNGAGKTTTIRMILGLAEPTAGHATIAGKAYSELHHPASVVGTLIDSAQPHPARTAHDHLRILAAERDVPLHRIEAVLALVDLGDAARRRVGQFSLGMKQRLGLAAALLADPEVLILDEPANGLDPAGIRWLRGFLRSFVASGRSVFVSSHQLGEIAQMADEVIVVNRGKLVTQRPIDELTSGSGASVRTPEVDRLKNALTPSGARVSVIGADHLLVENTSTAGVGEVAAREAIVLHELVPRARSLEDVFLNLTEMKGDSDDFLDQQ
jgi:ABC-2 type transport system ATP-binding protein